MGRRFDFRGGNAAAFRSTAPEVLLAGGAGTGKSLACLVKLYHLAGSHPNCRLLICRKTRASLTESALVTWERDVLGPGHSVLRKNPTLRRVRQSYRFPNGSEVVVAGLDKPDKVLSAEYDVAYCQEATELTLTDWETLAGRLRNGRVPYQQILGDCNPTTPKHWLYQRAEAGPLKLYASRHVDNPRYYDARSRQWTPAGEQYLSRLRGLTGPRLKRFLHGVWAQAEGLVYDGWDAGVHVVPRFDPPRAWPRYWAVDFGFTNPFVLQMWAEDPDGRLHLYREVYRTKLLVQDAAALALRLAGCPVADRPDAAGVRRPDWARSLDPRPTAVICDHGAEDRATFERHTGLVTIPADKKVLAGIADVADRLKPAGDGRPRLLLMSGALGHSPDATLREAGKPTCTADELDGYVWDEAAGVRERPVKANDHGADCLRYICRWVAESKKSPRANGGFARLSGGAF